MRPIHLLIPLLLTACLAVDAEPEPPAHVSAEIEQDPLEDLPCDLLKGPPELPEPEVTPAFRDPDEFDWVVAYQVGSPFQMLSSDDYQTFRASLRFNARGQLTAYRYDVLKAALSPADFAAAEQALGRRPKDWGDYDCIKRATCEVSTGRVCMSAC